MARAVYDLQSPNRRTAIVKRREAVSGEIMQFDDATFESAVIERHRRRGSGVEEALMDMCPAGASTRHWIGYNVLNSPMRDE